MPSWLFKWCSEKKKKEIVNFYMYNCMRLTREMLNNCPKELIERYLDYRIKDCDLRFFEIDFLNEKQIIDYIYAKVDNGEYISTTEFDKLNEKYKISYIFTHGLDNINIDIRNWFEMWKKAKGRDLNIDKILLD